MKKLSQTKNYYLAESTADIDTILKKISSYDVVAFDTETSGLNVRKDAVIGYSLSVTEGEGYYIPIYSWNGVELTGHKIVGTKKLLEALSSKKLVMHNASFDCRIVFNYANVDMLSNLHADTMLMMHTLNEEGPFGLKEISLARAKDIGFTTEDVANQEQVELEENVKKNGGVWKKTEKEIYKADLNVLAKYACFAEKSAYVTMVDGSTKLIEDVQVDDYVLDQAGTPQRVYELLKQEYKGILYNIETEVGRKLYNVTPDHRFLVLDQKSLTEKWVKVSDLKENDLLVRPEITRGSTEFDFSNDFWWLFGLYQAEGYVRVQKNNKYPVFTVHEKEVDSVCSVIKSFGYPVSIIKKKNSKACDLVITSSLLGDLFLDLSGGKFKCHEKKVSTKVFNYLTNNKEAGLSFISGVFDGDGHYKLRGSTHNYSLTVTSGSLVNIVDLLLGSYGINSTRGVYEPSKTSKGKTVSRKLRHTVTVFSNEAQHVLRYSKFKTFEKSLEYSPTFKKYVRIKKFEKFNFEGFVYNIEVENTHSYIVNGITSHNCADTDLTLRLYNLFSKELKQQELHNFFYQDEVMPLYKKVTIPMEQYGVHLDMPKLQKLAVEIKEDIAAIEQSLTTAILESPEGQEFVSRLCEEVGTKVSGGFAQAIAEHFNLDLPKNDNGKFSITAKTLKTLKNGPGKTVLETKSVEWITPETVEQIQLSVLKKDGPLFNLSSKQQLGTLIFDIMGVEPLSKTEKGAPQFNEDMIEHLAEKNIVSWAKELRVYNKLVKISGSSYERFLEEQDEGVFYPYYKQHGTTSGRFSSNVQQLPRPIEGNDEDPRIIKYTNEIRALFIANPGYIFIDDDYASLEPSVFAHDAEDQPLLDIFIKGEDFYSKIAIMALNLHGVSADKKAVNFLKNLNPKARQDAKAYALGIRYGAEEGKLSQLLGIEKEEAKKIIDRYFAEAPLMQKKMEQYKDQAKKQGLVRSEFGRIRHLPVAKEIYDYFGDDILDYSKLFDLCKKARMSFQEIKDIRRTYKNLLNNALNFPIQSAATTVISRAVIAVVDEFQQKGIDGWVCGIIHDQAIYCVKEEQKEIAAEIVQRCMEQTTKLKVPLYAVPQFTYNWKDGH